MTSLHKVGITAGLAIGFVSGWVGSKCSSSIEAPETPLQVQGPEAPQGDESNPRPPNADPAVPQQAPSNPGHDRERLRKAIAELDRVKKQLQTLKRENDAYLEEKEEKENRQIQFKAAKSKLTDEDFEPEIIMAVIGEEMEAENIEFEILAIDCELKPCIHFGRFTPNHEKLMDTWVPFRERMYGRGRGFTSRQRKISDDTVVFAIAPSPKPYPVEEFGARVGSILSQLSDELR